MKPNVIKLLIAFFISMSLLTTANIADAYHCKWIGGHYNKYGSYISKHKVCYYKHHYYHHCRWIKAHHNKSGHYVKKHKVCY